MESPGEAVVFGAFGFGAVQAVGHGDALAVNDFVVPKAQEGAVGGGGFAAVGPVFQGVVDFAALWWLLTSGEYAVFVAGDHGGADVGGGGAVGAANIEDLAVGAEDHSFDVAIANEASEIFDGDGPVAA